MLLHFFPLPTSQIETEKQVGEDVCLEAANSILVRPFTWKDQQAVCSHLGLPCLPSKHHQYMPYTYDFYSPDIPEVVTDCGADGDCFYRCINKYLQL